MLEIDRYISQELNINPKNIKNALKLLSEGATIPFVARYRKEYTGSLDETEPVSYTHLTLPTMVCV